MKVFNLYVDRFAELSPSEQSLFSNYIRGYSAGVRGTLLASEKSDPIWQKYDSERPLSDNA